MDLTLALSTFVSVKTSSSLLHSIEYETSGYLLTAMIHLELEDYHTNQTTNDDVSIESVII